MTHPNSKRHHFPLLQFIKIIPFSIFLSNLFLSLLNQAIYTYTYTYTISKTSSFLLILVLTLSYELSITPFLLFLSSPAQTTINLATKSHLLSFSCKKQKENGELLGHREEIGGGNRAVGADKAAAGDQAVRPSGQLRHLPHTTSPLVQARDSSVHPFRRPRKPYGYLQIRRRHRLRRGDSPVLGHQVPGPAVDGDEQLTE